MRIWRCRETADFFLCLHRIPWGKPVLVGREPAERLRDAPRAEPPHPLVEGRRGLARPDPGPVPAAEELLLQQAEEALGAGVVVAPDLARRAAGYAGIGGADVSLDRLRRQSQAPTVLHGLIQPSFSPSAAPRCCVLSR